MPVLNRIPKPSTFKDFGERDAFNTWMRYAMVVAAFVCVSGLLICWVMEGCEKGQPVEKAGDKPADAEAAKPPEPPPDLNNPVRPAPKSFPPDSNLPRGRETFASGPIDLRTFKPDQVLVKFEDSRVWFESDSDHHSDSEDDHVIHRSVEVPLKRLVNLLEQKGGKLKVHEAYRAAEHNKIHLATSLHCEGRAVDLTCEKVSLSDLAKLAWQSGFDFVLYEKPKRSGVHLHCSVKRNPSAPLPPRPEK